MVTAAEDTEDECKWCHGSEEMKVTPFGGGAGDVDYVRCVCAAAEAEALLQAQISAAKKALQVPQVRLKELETLLGDWERTEWVPPYDQTMPSVIHDLRLIFPKADAQAACAHCGRVHPEWQLPCVVPAPSDLKGCGCPDPSAHAPWASVLRDALSTGWPMTEAVRHAIRHVLAENTEQREALARINVPETRDFVDAVVREAAHQRLRWGSAHDAGKTDADWFWLIGYLAGKALHNPLEAPPPDGLLTEDDAREKRLHRIITVAAAAANWHLATLGKTDMRPGIEAPDGN